MKSTYLKITLIVMGVLFCLAGPGLLLPEAWLRGMVAWFAGADTVDALWPAGPAVDYMFRASLVAYLWIGVVLLLAAKDPERSKTQIDLSICGMFLFAIVTFTSGILNDLPLWWFLGDSLFSLAGGVFLFLFKPVKS